jgi:hypothetical protein
MARTDWTERMDRVLRDLWPRWDVPVADIAARVGVTTSAAYQRAANLRLPSRRPRAKKQADA